jgi:multiple sugar transport system substrate-binding protein
LSALLAACGGGDDGGGGGGGGGNGPVTLQFWKFVAETDDPAIKEAVSRWNRENPETKVDFSTFPADQYVATKLTTAFASGKGPDIFWISPGTFINYVNQKIPEPVDDMVDTEQYDDAAITAVSVDGQMYALPFEQEPVALYYRKDILEKEGIRPPTNWDELLSAAQALTTDKRKGIVIEPASGPYQNFTWYPFLWSAGGEVVNADSTASALNTPEAASAFELWGTLVREGYAPNKTQDITAEIAPLGNGSAAMQVCGFWAIGQMKANFKDVDYGVVPIPAPAGRDPVTVYGGWTQMINSQGENVDRAKEFTKWLWIENQEFPRTWACENSTKFSPRAPVNEACEDVFSKPPYSTFRDEVLPLARAEPRYPDQVVKAVGDGLQAAMFSGQSGEEAAALASEAIDNFLSSYNGAPLNPEA